MGGRKRESQIGVFLRILTVVRPAQETVTGLHWPLGPALPWRPRDLSLRHTGDL